jgi:hypothetical protein
MIIKKRSHINLKNKAYFPLRITANHVQDASVVGDVTIGVTRKGKQDQEGVFTHRPIVELLVETGYP